MNFNIHSFTKNIVDRCNQSRDELLGTRTVQTIHGPKQVRNDYRLIKCASDKPTALGIAHVDTVFSDSFVSRYANLGLTSKDSAVSKYLTRSLDPVKVLDNGDIQSGALDDRLGVSILLDILPIIMPNFHFDVLLTDNEEIGQSTGEDFTDFIYSKDCPEGMFERACGYSFLFQFDRAGTDVVTYDYYNPEAEDYLEDAGWHIGMGAFSDICSMFSLGIWGANFGCGYHRQHSNQCYVDMDQLDINLRKFASFVRRTEGLVFDHVVQTKERFSYDDWTDYRSGNYSSKSSSYNTYNDDPVIMYASKEDPFYSQEDRAWAEDWDKYVNNYNEDDEDTDSVDVSVSYDDDDLGISSNEVNFGVETYLEFSDEELSDDDFKAIDKDSRSAW